MDYDCNNDTASVWWDYALGADYYQVTVMGSRTFCETVDNHCNLTGLLCGQTYNVTVTAINDMNHCENTSDIVSFPTRESKLESGSSDLRLPPGMLECVLGLISELN